MLHLLVVFGSRVMVVHLCIIHWQQKKCNDLYQYTVLSADAIIVR